MNATDEVPAQIAAFLLRPTPPTWVESAARDLPMLLNDHANCEKKAAATALGLIFRYASDAPFCVRMSKLAREELRHYEQVLAIMRRRGIERRALGAGRYARELHASIRAGEPGRRIDTLVIGAFIEARSCERFALLVPRLDGELSRFYAGLLAAESRHFRVYLDLARSAAGGPIDERIAEIGTLESRLATEADTKLRFHSGPIVPKPLAVAAGS